MLIQNFIGVKKGRFNSLYILLISCLFLAWQSGCAYEFGIVTMFRNEANYLKEWIEYHHMLGADHFLLYNDRSSDHFAEVLAPYIQSHLVEVIEWHKDITVQLPHGELMPLFPTWQVMAYQDGLKKSKGNTKWLAFIDIDEFILPKHCGTILECLNKFFPSASGVYICWRNFGTNHVYITPEEPIIMQLTAASSPLHSRNASGKSIVRVADVAIEQVWSPHHLVLKNKAQYYNGSGQPLYFKGSDLQVDLEHTSDYIQINHYAMRDENFYTNVRVPKAISREYGELDLLQEHYQSFNQMQDYEMINFIKKYHPTMYHSFWHGKHNETDF